jgi:hypothetical protein
MYVVMECLYEYNDQTYDLIEGGNAVIAYENKVQAQKEVEIRTMNAFRLGDIKYLGNYETGLVFNKNANFILEKHGFESLDDYDIFMIFYNQVMNSDLFSDNDLLILVKSLINPLYYIQEIEVG